jgi:hypothetical protein
MPGPARPIDVFLPVTGSSSYGFTAWQADGSCFAPARP